MMENIYLTAYGDTSENEKGIISLCFCEETKTISKQHVIHIDGKCNMVIEDDLYLYTSVKNETENRLTIYDKKSFECIRCIPCRYVYSFGQKKGDVLYLSSYEQGVDSVYDMKQDIFLSHYIHGRKGYTITGKSHYIQCLDDGRIISIDNALQQVYVYKNSNFDIEKVLTLDDKNPRLLSIHPHTNRGYLNTECSNEIITLDMNDIQVLCCQSLSEDKDEYSAGNAISKDGRYLCISLRKENKICVFAISNDDDLHLIDSFPCGCIPRDLMFIKNYLFVTCTKSNRVEVYEINGMCNHKICEISLQNPITFAMR